jgi:hypothetical protein
MKTQLLATLVGVTVLAVAPVVEAQSQGPCALATTAEVAQAFPGAKPGRLKPGLEELGLRSCVWEYPGGELSILITTDGVEENVKEEAVAMSDVFLDPLRADAARHVRYERLPGVGDEALAMVEREDKSKGFRTSAAILVVRRGPRVATVLSTDLAHRDREVALKVLADLGKVIAKRLG